MVFTRAPDGSAATRWQNLTRELTQVNFKSQFLPRKQQQKLLDTKEQYLSCLVFVDSLIYVDIISNNSKFLRQTSDI